jgi:hypothetical protein
MKEKKAISHLKSEFNKILPDSKRSNSRFNKGIYRRICPLSKRSQTNVIAVVLIILIVIVAVVIVWNILSPLIREQSEEIDINPLMINLEVQEVVVFLGGGSKISLRRGSGDGEMSGIKFIFYDQQGLSYTTTKEENLPRELETRTYYFSPPRGIGNIRTVKAVPIVGNRLGREFSAEARKVFEIPRGLVSWWRFEDSSDFIGKNNGREVGNAKIENGVLILEGSGYFDGGNDRSLNMGENLAISVWVKIDKEGEIIKKGVQNKNYGLSVNTDKEAVFSFKQEFIKSYEKIPSQEWAHVLVSVDWDGLYKIYINGEPASNFETRDVIPVINNENVIIGEGFKGQIDELMIFNRSLTSANAEYLYNSIKHSE